MATVKFFNLEITFRNFKGNIVTLKNDIYAIADLKSQTDAYKRYAKRHQMVLLEVKVLNA